MESLSYIHTHISFQADQICYAVLCVFSYIAAGMEHRQAKGHEGQTAAGGRGGGGGEDQNLYHSRSVPDINLNSLRLNNRTPSSERRHNHQQTPTRSHQNKATTPNPSRKHKVYKTLSLL